MNIFYNILDATTSKSVLNQPFQILEQKINIGKSFKIYKKFIQNHNFFYIFPVEQKINEFTNNQKIYQSSIMASLNIILEKMAKLTGGEIQENLPEEDIALDVELPIKSIEDLDQMEYKFRESVSFKNQLVSFI